MTRLLLVLCTEAWRGGGRGVHGAFGFECSEPRRGKRQGATGVAVGRWGVLAYRDRRRPATQPGSHSLRDEQQEFASGRSLACVSSPAARMLVPLCPTANFGGQDLRKVVVVMRVSRYCWKTELAGRCSMCLK